MDSAFRYLGVEIEDAIAETIEVYEDRVAFANGLKPTLSTASVLRLARITVIGREREINVPANLASSGQSALGRFEVQSDLWASLAQ